MLAQLERTTVQHNEPCRSDRPCHPTGLRNCARQLRHRANNDMLTGLLRRAAFSQQVAFLLSGARRSEEAASLCLIDLDSFKEINDGYGHAAGDSVLASLGKLLSQRFRMPQKESDRESQEEKRECQTRSWNPAGSQTDKVGRRHENTCDLAQQERGAGIP